MIAFLKGLVLLPIAVIVVLLAVANRGPVLFSLDPVTSGPPQFAYMVPLYALLFGALAVGVIVGGIGAWLAQSKHRRDRRAFRREAHDLRQEAGRLRRSSSAPVTPALSPGQNLVRR